MRTSLMSFAVLLILSSGAEAQLLCKGVHSAATTVADVSQAAEKPSSKEGGKEKKSGARLSADLAIEGVRIVEGPTDIRSLLKMVSNTLFMGATPKATLEKGELYLAVPLKDGSTIQAEYRADVRRDGTLGFKMAEITLITPSGEMVRLESSPLSADGQIFKSKSYVWGLTQGIVGNRPVTVDVKAIGAKDLQEWSDVRLEKGGERVALETLTGVQKDPVSFLVENQNLASSKENTKWKLTEPNRFEEVALPREITGDAMTNFKVWIERLDAISREDLHQINLGRSLGSLKFQYYKKSNIDFMSKTIKKQSFKYMLFGIIIAAYVYSEELTNWATNNGYIESDLDNVSAGYLSPAELQIFQKFIVPLGATQDSDKLIEMLSLKTNSKRPSSSEDFVAHHNLLAQLLVKESLQKNGRMNVIEASEGFANDFIPEVSRGSLVYNEKRGSLSPDFFISHFERQGIIALTLNRTEKEMPRLRTILIKKSKFPELFERLLQLEILPVVTDKSKPAQPQ